MGDAFNIVRDFELQSATLASVLGTTREGIVALDQDALRLGATTQFTATQVGELQEAFARLGFTQDQILASTGATLQGAAALQSDLGETAELVGATLNQFQLDASESQRVVDVLSRSTQISALNFERLSTALPIVGTTASAVGVSLETVTSQLGVLSSRGIDASTASTGLRNLFIELSNQGISYQQALDQIAGSTDRLGTASQLFGTRGATIGLVLSETTDTVAEYNAELLNAEGTARVASETLLNTLNGSLQLLNSAWEGYILNISNSADASESLTGTIRFLADNLDTIISAAGGAISIFAAYRIGLLASSAANVTFAGSLNTLRTALAANPIGLALVAISFSNPYNVFVTA